MYFKTLSHIYWILCGKENYQILQKNPFSSQMHGPNFSMGNCLTLHKATGLLCISIAQAIVIRFMSVSMTRQKTFSEKNAIAMSLILFVLVPSFLVRECYQLNKSCVYKGPGEPWALVIEVGVLLILSSWSLTGFFHSLFLSFLYSIWQIIYKHFPKKWLLNIFSSRSWWKNGLE